MDLLTIGDSSIDLYMKVAQEYGQPEVNSDGEVKLCFYHGSKIPVDHFETSIAGNSINVGVGAKTLGLDVGIYTEVGDDQNGQRIVRELKELNIETKYIDINKNRPTNVHAIIVYGGDRTIFSHHLKWEYNNPNWEKPKWIYYTSMAENFPDFQKDLIKYLGENRDIGVAFNPGTLHMKAGFNSFKEFLLITDIFFVNKDEAGILVGEKPLEQLHIDLHKLGVKMSVVTNGKEGASAFDGENLISVNAFTDERPVLDKTGAGDAFASGFLSAIFYGKGMQQALGWGVINSGSVIKEIGSIKGLCNKDQIEDLITKLS